MRDPFLDRGVRAMHSVRGKYAHIADRHLGSHDKPLNLSNQDIHCLPVPTLHIMRSIDTRQQDV